MKRPAVVLGASVLAIMLIVASVGFVRFAAVPQAAAPARPQAAPVVAQPADTDAVAHEEGLQSFLADHPQLQNRRAMGLAYIREKVGENGGEGSREIIAGPEQERYEDRAYPEAYVAPERREAAKAAQDKAEKRGKGYGENWQLVGPSTGNVPGEVTYTGRPTVNAGRVTSLAVASDCNQSSCALYLGAAGGGVWYTANALAPTPVWTSFSEGLTSNAIGSIYIARTKEGVDKTIYVGTGEPNGSGDSEAGVGLFRSDSGKEWQLLPGSVAVARDRSIAAIAVEPKNQKHIWIGTAVARHGSSSVNGGRFTPPNAPQVGLYESKDGGKTFTLAFSKTADVVNPATANGSDFFRGGVSKIELAPNGLPYFSVFGYGLFRATSDGGFEQVFASAGGGLISASASSRTEFALAPMGQKLRIYLGDTGGAPAAFYRVDDANVPASQLTTGTTNPGWLQLSNATPGTPGFASYNYCGGQCSYDMPVASPPGKPDAVWIGGQMQYSEIFTRTPPSNGRAIQRSVDAGVSFTDMTNDNQGPAPVGMHPDEHAIVFSSANPDIAFIGSDGGVVRTSGLFADASAGCDSRGISGTDLVNCKAWLKAIPTQIFSLNDGLSTLQFQSVSLNPKNANDLLGGTQDNGTWALDQARGGWFESVGGDGGQSGVDAVNPNIRVHSYYSPQHDINFRGTEPLGWNWISDPLLASAEAASFYVPIITDPVVGGTMFDGLQHIWRTTDSGGPRAYLEQHCNEFTGDFSVQCGDWVPLGGSAGSNNPGDLVGAAYGADKGTGYVVAITRSRSDHGTMWAGTRRGRLFISTNADAADAANVAFTRIDTAAQPRRFISGIVVDPANANHAWVSFSGYDAYTPTTPGHVFEVTYNPSTSTATWVNLSYDLGDQPITSIARNDKTGELFAATDFGVSMLRPGAASWLTAAGGLPPVAVYGLTVDANARVLYAATHGRSIWKLDLGK